MTCVEIMLELVRSAVFERAPQIPNNEVINWDELMNYASKEGLIGWTWDGICRLPFPQQPPRLQKINWSLSTQEIVDRYYLQKNVLARLVDTCGQNNMRLMLLKGISLSLLYPKPELRPSGDIDIYLFEDYEKGNALFCQSDSEFRHKHTSFNYLGVHIENHQTPIDIDTNQRCMIEKYIESKLGESILSPLGYYVMDPMTNLVYLVMHSVRHFEPNAAVPIKNIIDIGMFLLKKQRVLEAEKCFSIFTNLGLLKQFEMLVIVAEHILGIDLTKYKKGLINKYQIKLVQLQLKEGGLGNPIPKCLPFTPSNFKKWIQYFSIVRVYKVFADPEVLYYSKVLRHLNGVLIKRAIGKSESDSIFKLRRA